VSGGARGRRPGRVYAIADAGRIAPRRLPDAVAEMAAAGIRTIQLRAKALSDLELWRLAEATLERLEGWPGTLWIDDRVDLAAALPFDGVHLGQRDLQPGAARAQLAAVTAIGYSTHDERQLDAGDRDPDVDWLAVGPVFATASKEGADPELGLERLLRLRARTRRPLVAIGGIDAARLRAVLACGVDAAAMIAAVCDGDIAANCRRLLVAAGEAP
jgi:thiamine-phosphate pyrophosphorylase